MLHCIKPRGRDAASTERNPRVFFGECAMSAPMTKSQMAFQLPRLSYIDKSWEEPAVQREQSAARPRREQGFASWVAARVRAFSAWRANARALAELNRMTDRELFDVGLSRSDVPRLFDNRYNEDLRAGRRVF
jgi:uncharacterized protein YjiS (DUF1127 family)